MKWCTGKSSWYTGEIPCVISQSIKQKGALRAPFLRGNLPKPKPNYRQKILCSLLLMTQRYYVRNDTNRGKTSYREGEKHPLLITLL
jgi:hypothetical protein